MTKGEFAKDEFWALRTLNISPLCLYELVCPSLAWASQSVESLVLHPVRASWLQFSPNHPPFHHPSPSLQLAPETICNICMHIRRPTDRNTHTNILTETTINTNSNFSPLLRDNVFPIYKILVASSGQVLGMHDHITSSEPCEIRCNAHNFCSAPYRVEEDIFHGNLVSQSTVEISKMSGPCLFLIC